MDNESSHIYEIFRKFLFSIVNKEFLIFLSFLVLSGAFWMLMALNETTEREYNVPVRLVNVPRNVVMTTEIQDTVRVTLRDKGFTLFAYWYRNSFVPINLNFNNYANKKTGKGIIPQGDIQKVMQQRLYGSTKVVSVRPDKLEFFFNYGISKRVPVRLNGHIVPGKNYYLARTQFSPENVTVYASKDILDSISYVSTEYLNLENFEDTLVQVVELKTIRGVKVVPTQTQVTLYPDILTEETIDVPIMASGMPEGKVLRTFPPRVKVSFVAGASIIRNIKPEQFKVVVNYSEVADHPSDKCNIYLLDVPHGVSKPHLEVSQVDYLIEQQ